MAYRLPRIGETLVSQWGAFTCKSSLLEESRRAIDPVASQLQGAANILLGTAPRFGGEDVWFGFQILSVGI